MAAAAPEPLQQPLQFAQKVAATSTSAAKMAVGASAKPQASKSPPSDPVERKKIAKAKAFNNLGDGQKAITAAPDVDESSVVREWFVDDLVERLALDGSFTIYFFIGDVPPSNVGTNDYLSYPTLAAANHIFAAPTNACGEKALQHDIRHG